MAAPSSSVDVTLARWRERLLDLSSRNPLINWKGGRDNGLAISHPGQAKVFQRLVQGKQPWNFWMPPKEEDAAWDLTQNQPKAHELVCGNLGRRRLRQALTGLFRHAQQSHQEHGLNLLYLGCGFLEWRDADNQEIFRSPLLLIPVALSRKSVQEPFVLGPGEEAPFINPALIRRLQNDFKVALPAGPVSGEEAALTAFHKSVQAAIAKFSTWKLDTSLILAVFPFFKGTMWDEAPNAGAHSFVRLLAGDSNNKLLDELSPATVPDEHELDVGQNLESTFPVLDADGGQSLCLEAAKGGNSFIIQGPPGTGKSQTIVNLIADGLAGGKKILCVSSNLAALETIGQRLRQVGLEDFSLDLFDEKIKGRAVVAELARCFGKRPKISPAAGPDLAKLKKVRTQLARYVQALHQSCEPLQRSAWSALADLAPLAATPLLPLGMPLQGKEEAGDGVTAVNEITPVWLDEARQAIQRLQQLWHIRAQRDFPWWGFKADRYNQQLREEVLGLIDKIKVRLDKVMEVAKHYADQIGVTGPISWILKVCETLEALPGKVPTHWLLEKDLNQLAQDLEKCSEQYHRLGQARAPLTDRYGPPLWQVAEGTASQVDRVWHTAAPLLASGDERGAGLLTHQQLLRGWAADTQKRIPGWITEARTLEKWLAVALPAGAGARPGQAGADGKMDPSPHTLRQLLRLANLCQSENPPERTWAHNPQTLEEARQLIVAAKPAFASYHQRRKKILEIYQDNVFDLELDRMAAGFAGPYQSWLRFFSPQFRRDRRALKRRSRAYEYPTTAAQDVTEARDLLVEKTRLEGEGPKRQPLLGRYEKGLDTDFEAAERGTRVAAEAVEIVHQLGCTALPPRFLDALCSGTAPQEKIRAAAKRLHDSLGAWLHVTQELKAQLPMLALPGTGQPLEESALSAINHYARDLQGSLNQFGSLTDAVLAKAPAPPPDAVTLVADLKQAEEVRAFESANEDEARRWSQRIGTGFQGLATNWEALRKCFAWIRKIRDLFKDRPAAPGATTGLPEQIIQLAGAGGVAPASRDLRHAQEQYEQTLHGLENRFGTPGLLLEGKRFAESPPEAVKQRLAILRDRVAELADWIDWRQLPSRFEHLGLKSFWEALQKEPPPQDQLLPIFNKAFLTSWLEAVWKQEPVLASFRRQDHEKTIAEFAELDRKWLRATAQVVLQRAEEKRPRPDASSSEIVFLKQEAEKKNYAGSMSQLFLNLPTLLGQIKPCLLCSPWLISRFLAADKFRFDLVIIDEANQIAVEDALPALNRGGQIIVLGDDQQPGPPSSGEEDQPESLLAACQKAGLEQRTLRTHYRSRQESLFAFANQHAYDLGVETFPNPRPYPNQGLFFRFVPDGNYDLNSRQNVREAQVVADLVVEHLRTQADKSLGVLACEVSQAQLIAEEIERRLVKHPELEKLLPSDRRDGFFVKSWESASGIDRDAIVLSIGFGPDSQKKPPVDFGLLSQDDGPALLHSAITRARQKMTVVSSLRIQEIQQKALPPGVVLLRTFLEFAEKCATGLKSGGIPDSHPFILEIIQELHRRGHSAVAQVGLSSNRIEVGVVDPDAPGHYLLGIDFDSPLYHTASSVRDRDRLRPEILQSLGWTLHRIWSPDWIARRQEEIDRLLKVLEDAKRARSAKPSGPAKAIQPPRPVRSGKRS